MDDPRDYEVGYGKPPVHSRFKPGQSGNPKGRRTRKTEPASLLAEILKELNAVVTINENGEKMRVTNNAEANKWIKPMIRKGWSMT